MILSSHILSEVQTICEKVLIISKGRLVAFVAEAAAGEIEEILKGIEAVSGWQMNALEDGRVHVDAQMESGETDDICRCIFFAFAERHRALLQLTSKKVNLEDVFIELTESDEAFAKTAEQELTQKDQTEVDRTEESGVDEE